jgi:phosphoglycolate phosphatase
MIGESKNAIVAAKRANIQCVGLTYGYNYGEDIACYNTDFVTSEFKRLLDCLIAQFLPERAKNIYVDN